MRKGEVLLILSGRMWRVGYICCSIKVKLGCWHQLFVITLAEAIRGGINDVRLIPIHLNQP